MEIFCTYPLSISNRSKGKTAAIHRWGTPRVNRIEGRAKSAGLRMFFVSGSFGLIPHDQPVNADLRKFTETDIEGILPRVQNSLKENQIAGITFYLNPAEKQGLAYLRLLVIACFLEHSALTTRSFKDEEFPDWMESMRDARLARSRARELADKPARFHASFESLLKKYGRDPMILFERANAYADVYNFEAAATDYDEAARLFPLPEFENLAHQKARGAKQKIMGSSVGDHEPSELERGVSWPESDPGIRMLYIQARDLIARYPSASVSLCRTALVRIIATLEGANPREVDSNIGLGQRIESLRVAPRLKDQMIKLATRRNEIEYGMSLATTIDAKFCIETLMEVLVTLYPRR